MTLTKIFRVATCLAAMVSMQCKNSASENPSSQGNSQPADQYRDPTPEEKQALEITCPEDGKLTGDPMTRCLSKGRMRLQRVWCEDSEKKPHGPSRTYWSDCILQEQGSFSEGKRVGKWRIFHRNGEVKQESIFSAAGKPQGTWTWWYENGAERRETEFATGQTVEWYKDGKKRAEGRMEAGGPTGTWKLWDKEGKVREMDYGVKSPMDVPHGKSTTPKPSGGKSPRPQAAVP